MAAPRLRPLAPLAVIGAGLMIMSFATRPASADDSPVPQNVQIVPSGKDLIVSWVPPTQQDGLTDFDVLVAAGGTTVLDRSVPATEDTTRITAAQLAGQSSVTVTVSADYGADKRVAASPLTVTLTGSLPKPTTAPAVQAEGRVLKIRIPAGDAVEGANGRIVRILRDGAEWATVTLPLEKASVKKRVAAGHDYTAAYQVVGSDAQSAFGPESDAVTVGSATGPSAVRISVKAVDRGVKVAWSAAAGTDLHGYAVRVVKDGERVGTAYTAPEVHSVVVPASGTDGAVGVTVTATDASGRTSTSTATLQP